MPVSSPRLYVPRSSFERWASILRTSRRWPFTRAIVEAQKFQNSPAEVLDICELHFLASLLSGCLLLGICIGRAFGGKL